jgi:hypothetical protein
MNNVFSFILVFPSEPRSIHIEFLNNSDVKISWVEPAVTGKGSLFYIVEIQIGGKGKWKKENFTKELFTTLSKPSSSDRIRVCAKNDVDRNKASCSPSQGKSCEIIEDTAFLLGIKREKVVLCKRGGNAMFLRIVSLRCAPRHHSQLPSSFKCSYSLYYISNGMRQHSDQIFSRHVF